MGTTLKCYIMSIGGKDVIPLFHLNIFKKWKIVPSIYFKEEAIWGEGRGRQYCI